MPRRRMPSELLLATILLVSLCLTTAQSRDDYILQKQYTGQTFFDK
jgi:hypothetical protein